MTLWHVLEAEHLVCHLSQFAINSIGNAAVGLGNWRKINWKSSRRKLFMKVPIYNHGNLIWPTYSPQNGRPSATLGHECRLFPREIRLLQLWRTRLFFMFPGDQKHSCLFLIDRLSPHPIVIRLLPTNVTYFPSFTHQLITDGVGWGSRRVCQHCGIGDISRSPLHSFFICQRKVSWKNRLFHNCITQLGWNENSHIGKAKEPPKVRPNEEAKNVN